MKAVQQSESSDDEEADVDSEKTADDDSSSDSHAQPRSRGPVYFNPNRSARTRKKRDDVYMSEKQSRAKAQREQAKIAQELALRFPGGSGEPVTSAASLLHAVKKRFGCPSIDTPPAAAASVPYIRGTPKPHQLVGLAWFQRLYRNGLGGILGDEMGVGKTLQTIALVAWLVNETDELAEGKPPVLVVCPLSTVDNWASEFEKFAPSVRVLKYVGDKEERLATRDSVTDHLRRKKVPSSGVLHIPKIHCVVTTPELLKLDDYFLTAFDSPLIVVDEAHRLKNPAVAAAFNEPKRRCGLLHVRRRLLLTGTPLQNTVRDLWSLLNVANPALFQDCESFCSTWFAGASRSDQKARAPAVSALREILRYVQLRRTKVEAALRLPTKTEVVLSCPLAPVQKLLYRSFLRKTAGLLLAAKGAAGSVSNVVMQLRKCCLHPYLFPSIEREPYEIGEHVVLNSGKLFVLDKLLAHLKDTGHRVLVFSQFTSVLDILQDYMIHRGHAYERLDGSLRAADRREALASFTTSADSFVFLLSTRAGGLGLNLTTADTVVFFDHDWNPTMDLQAQDRAHRMGQTKPVTVYRLLSKGTIEDIILSRGIKKTALIKAVLDTSPVIDDAPAAGKKHNPSSVELLELVKAAAAMTFPQPDRPNRAPVQEITDPDVCLLDSVADVALEKAGAAETPIETYLDPEFRALLNEEESMSDLLKKARVVQYDVEGAPEPAAADPRRSPSPPTTAGPPGAPKPARRHMTYEGVDYTKDDVLKRGEAALRALAAAIPLQVPVRRGAAPQPGADDAPCKPEVAPSEREDARRARLKKRWEAAGYVTKQVEPVSGYRDEVDKLITQLQRYMQRVREQARGETGNAEQDEEETLVWDEGRCDKPFHVEGDVTKPESCAAATEILYSLCNGDDEDSAAAAAPNVVNLVFQPVDNSGVWGAGGTFSALDQLSDAVGDHYEAAKKAQDLRLGDVHLLPLYPSLAVLLATVMRASAAGKVDFPLLEAALAKIGAACRKLAAARLLPAVHLPFFGGHHSNWVAIEKYIAKHLAGFPVFVHYFRRPTRGGRRGKRVRDSPRVADDDEDGVPSKQQKVDSPRGSPGGMLLDTPEETEAAPQAAVQPFSLLTSMDSLHRQQQQQQQATSGDGPTEPTAVDQVPDVTESCEGAVKS
ncbi:putative helicase CHR10 [Diplonema papillatum]|nr:putative helicase CHR10 [Diplonema papillatum]